MMCARDRLLAAVTLAGAAVLGACASAPVHYYTLVAPAAEDTVGVGAVTGPTIQFELLASPVPAQVDQSQLIVREGAERVGVLDAERWIAPLGDEVHAALAADLARALPGQDVGKLIAGGKPMLRIQLDLRRFESAPGAYALIEAAWSLRLPNDTAVAPLTCTTTISERVGPGYDALVRGHQRALGRLAAEIAAVAQPYIAGQATHCR
jgi:uncharacterized lipoprotein YmbA